MTSNLESWETQEEAKHAAGRYTGSPLGGGLAASRREAEEHRLTDMLAEQARRELVEATMAALRKCTLDTERKDYISTLHKLHLTPAERGDLMELLRKQGIEQLLEEVEEQGASRRGQVYMAIRKYSILPGTGEEFLQRVQEDFVPIVSQLPGFIAYHALPVGNDQVASISIFNTPVGAVESTPSALQWVQEHLAGILQGTPEVMTGQVRASSEPGWAPAHPPQETKAETLDGSQQQHEEDGRRHQDDSYQSLGFTIFRLLLRPFSEGFWKSHKYPLHALEKIWYHERKHGK
jgi:hypothetical protein